MEGREGLPSLKQKKSPRERAGQGGSRRLSQTKEAYWKKEDYLEAAHTEAGKLMSKYLRLLLLLQPRVKNLSKLSAEGLTRGAEIGICTSAVFKQLTQLLCNIFFQKAVRAVTLIHLSHPARCADLVRSRAWQQLSQEHLCKRDILQSCTPGAAKVCSAMKLV